MDVVIRPPLAHEVPLLAGVERDGDRRFANYAGLPPGFDGVVPVPALRAGAAEGRLWVACPVPPDGEGAVVGFALATCLDGAAHLEQLSVVRRYQGRGVGGRLVGAVRAWADSEGLPALTLCTFADVVWNRPLYEHLGFAVLPEERWTPGLRSVFERDADSGLDLARRVVMRLVLAEGADAPDAGGAGRPTV